MKAATLSHPRGSMGEEIIGATEFAAMQDVFSDLMDTGTGAARFTWNDEADRLEIERINLTGARQREATRLSTHGAEPWDHAAGDRP